MAAAHQPLLLRSCSRLTVVATLIQIIVMTAAQTKTKACHCAEN